MNPRKIAAKILQDFENTNQGLESLIDKYFNDYSIDRRDKRLVFNLVYGVMRRRSYLDFLINQYLHNKKSSNKMVYTLLRLGVYQIVYTDKIPDYAAVNETVNIAKTDKSLMGFSGLLNAVLRKIIKLKGRYPRPDATLEISKRLSIEHSHPEWLVKRWLTNFGLYKTKKLLRFNNERPLIFIRRKWKGIPTRRFESEARDICRPVESYHSLYYELKEGVKPDSIDLFNDGLCTVQAVSSGWAAALADIKKGENILDVCASPGGKTAVMAEHAEGSGNVFACDISYSRIEKLLDTIQRMATTDNVTAVVCDGLSIPFNCLFDKVLVDAPCSSTGVLHRNPDGRWLKKEEDIDAMAVIQAGILDSAAKFVVNGGILIYSTCSLEKEENMEQVERFLSRHPGFKIDSGSGLVPEKYLNNEGALMMTPYEHSVDGMFAVRLKKNI